MTVSMLEIGLMIALTMIVIALAVMFFLSLEQRSKYNKNVTTKGLNGTEGTTLNLSCPSGQVISFANPNSHTTRGSIVSIGDPQCDAFYQPPSTSSSAPAKGGQNDHFFNPYTTIDVFASDSPFKSARACSGQQTCSIKVPTKDEVLAMSPNLCIGRANNTGQVAYIGTYDCVPKGA